MADPRYCQVTGRVLHASRAAALAAARDAARQAEKYRKPKLPRGVYRCGFCSAWHLTSMSRSQYLKWPGRRRRPAREDYQR